MLPFATSFLAIAAAFMHPTCLAALALGIYFWFFSDTIRNTSYLDIKEGYARGLAHLALVLPAAAGSLSMLGDGREVFPRITPFPEASRG
jgi:hypothetical protein